MKQCAEVRIFNEHSRNTAITDIMNLEVITGAKEHSMKLRPYQKDRSLEMSALSHVWYAQVAAKEREYTAEQVKGLCKLHFGIPILREDQEFSELYDRAFKPMDYETRLEIMTKPGLFDVTSLMKTAQILLYMEQIQQHYADRVQLRYPNEPPGR